MPTDHRRSMPRSMPAPTRPEPIGDDNPRPPSRLRSLLRSYTIRPCQKRHHAATERRRNRSAMTRKPPCPGVGTGGRQLAPPHCRPFHRGMRPALQKGPRYSGPESARCAVRGPWTRERGAGRAVLYRAVTVQPRPTRLSIGRYLGPIWPQSLQSLEIIRRPLLARQITHDLRVCE